MEPVGFLTPASLHHIQLLKELKYQLVIANSYINFKKTKQI